MKSKLYILVIVLCLVGAALLLVRNRSLRGAGVESLKSGELLWIKCTNPACGAAYSMDKKAYFQQVEEKKQSNPVLVMLPTAPPLTCTQCGKDTAFRAVKCEKCGHVFRYGSRKGKSFDFADRCPECGYSKIEADRKAAP
jgi:predicted Zn-ribbon and HTH transcriptional regulator